MKHFGNFTLAFALLFSADALAAGSLRQAYISTTGADRAGCGVGNAPCRTLQYALDNALADAGVLYLLRPGDYGPASLSRSATIINSSGGVAGVLNFTGAAIVLANSSSPPTSAVVTLQDITLDGGSAPSATGIIANSSVVRIVRCSIRNVRTGVRASNGLSSNPQVLLVNTTISRASVAGVDATGSGRFGLGMSATAYGLTVAQSGTGISAFMTKPFSLANSTLSGNQTRATGAVLADNVKISGNNVGFAPIEYLPSFAPEFLNSKTSRLTIVDNRTGVQLVNNAVTSAPAKLETYKNSVIEQNVIGDIVGNAANVTTVNLQ